MMSTAYKFIDICTPPASFLILLFLTNSSIDNSSTPTSSFHLPVSITVSIPAFFILRTVNGLIKAMNPKPTTPSSAHVPESTTNPFEETSTNPFEIDANGVTQAATDADKQKVKI